MAQGLQFFDSGGNLVLDITHRVLKFLGQATTTGGVDGSVTDSNFTAFTGTTPWFAILAGSITTNAADVPKIGVSGNVLSWEYAPDGTEAVTIIYGVY